MWGRSVGQKTLEGKKSSFKFLGLALQQHKNEVLEKRQQKSSQCKENWWHEKIQSTIKTPKNSGENH